MADNTPIEWTDATWNPITGCSVVSPGCANCYAMKLAGTRMKHHWSRQSLTQDTKAGPVWTGEVRFNTDWLDQPLRWKRPRRIFVCAHGDIFHEAVPDAWIDKVFAVMALSPQHTFQVLTKRAERMRDYLTAGADRATAAAFKLAHEVPACFDHHIDGNWQYNPARLKWPLPNVWLGVSVEDHFRADERIPFLLDTPAAKRFISAEPLIGSLRLDYLDRGPRGRLYPLRGEEAMRMRFPDGETGDFGAPTKIGGKLDWVIVGGESGPNARPMHPEWARSLRDQCQAAGVAFFLKQWGEYQAVDEPDGEVTSVNGRAIIAYSHGDYIRVGKKAAGRLLDGIEYSEIPT
jgi:protein gp37